MEHCAITRLAHGSVFWANAGIGVAATAATNSATPLILPMIDRIELLPSNPIGQVWSTATHQMGAPNLMLERKNSQAISIAYVHS
jgi:hypothetical protein